jgi:hypothetical protein
MNKREKIPEDSARQGRKFWILDFGFWIEERHRKFPKHNFMLICSLKHVYQKNHDRNSLFHEIVVKMPSRISLNSSSQAEILTSPDTSEAA